MRIATMVTGCITSPQPSEVTYAPIDIAIAISEGLQQLGHTVDYYGPEGSHLGVPVVTCDLKPFPRNSDGNYVHPDATSPDQEVNLSRIWDERLINEMVKRANNGEYDALIIHPIDRGLSFGNLTKIPIIYTLHDPIVPWRADIYRRFLTKNQHMVSITDSQRQPALDLTYAATIYNGIDVDQFNFVEKPKDHVVFAGRIMPEKNPADAIKAARLANVQIKLFGQVLPKGDEYFNNFIKPQLSEDVIYGGFINRSELAIQYGEAKALVAPIVWDEPFGLVFIEAMACGTPVIAFRRGSVPEVVVDGKTGFIVDTVEEMAEAIKKIDSIDRKACRQHVIDNFSNQCMARGYDKLLSDVTKLS